MSVPVSWAHNPGRFCDRQLAATQPILPGVQYPHEHPNAQLPLYGLTLILIGGGDHRATHTAMHTAHAVLCTFPRCTADCVRRRACVLL